LRPVKAATLSTATPRNAGYQIITTRYADIVTNLPAPFSLAAAPSGTGSTLTWPATAGSTYSVFGSDDVAGPYTRLMFGLNFLGATGTFAETPAAPTRFYRVTSP